MDWCDVCKYNPPDYSSHEPDKPCGDCWVFGEGNEPSKFVETENRPTNADRIRSMTDEELADVFDHVQGDAFLVGIGERKNSVYPGADISWLDWLKQEVDT